MYDFKWITTLVKFLNILKPNIWSFCKTAGFATIAINETGVHAASIHTCKWQIIGYFWSRESDTHWAQSFPHAERQPM